jgi:hypothetical protein
MNTQRASCRMLCQAGGMQFDASAPAPKLRVKIRTGSKRVLKQETLLDIQKCNAFNKSSIF